MAYLHDCYTKKIDNKLNLTDTFTKSMYKKKKKPKV